jgi:hypothetical protein
MDALLATPGLDLVLTIYLIGAAGFWAGFHEDAHSSWLQMLVMMVLWPIVVLVIVAAMALEF